MAERQVSSPGSVVKISNALARASRAVKSVYEPRLVALVASRVRKDDQDFQDYEILLSELLGGASDGRTRQLVADVVDGLLGRVLTLSRPNGWVKCNLFSWVEYDGKAGVVRARFDPGLKEHYLNLKSHFTEYSLMEFLCLPSTYSQRLFEVLKSWDDQPECKITLSDLFEMLDVPPTLQRYPDFRRKVLEKAHKDITGKTSLRYEWEPLKKGRAVESIRFTFGHRAKNAAIKKTAETQKKKSADNNALLKKAVKCFREKGEKCQSQKNALCELCLRLVKPATTSQAEGANTCSHGSAGVQVGAQSVTVTVAQVQGALMACGMGRADAGLFVRMLEGTGKLVEAWAMLPDLKKRFMALPKSKRKGLGQFVRKTLREELYTEN